MKYLLGALVTASVIGSGVAIAEDSYALVNKSTKFDSDVAYDHLKPLRLLGNRYLYSNGVINGFIN